MKVTVNRLGEKFSNVTEVVNGVVVANSVNNLAQAIKDDKYVETDPVRLAAAREGTEADAHAAEVMQDLVDKAEVAKVDGDPDATEDYRDTANVDDVENIYTMPVSIKEGIHSDNRLILSEALADDANIDEVRSYPVDDYDSIPSTVYSAIYDRLAGVNPSSVGGNKEIFNRGKGNSLMAEIYNIKKESFKVTDEKNSPELEGREVKLVGSSTLSYNMPIWEYNDKSRESRLELERVMGYFAEHPQEDTFVDFVFSRTTGNFLGERIYTKVIVNKFFYPQMLVKDENYRIGVALPTGNGELAEKVADLFGLDYTEDSSKAREWKVPRFIWIRVPKRVASLYWKQYLTKALGRTESDLQTW